MSFLSKLNGFRNPITGARRAIGTCIIIIGLIMCIPSVFLFFQAGALYEKSNVYDQSAQFSTLQIDENQTIVVTGIMKTGNNYDIKIYVTAFRPENHTALGGFSLTYSDTALSISGNFASSSVNGTYSSSHKEVMETDFTSDVDTTFTFKITSMNDLSSLSVRVKVYENPNRFWVDFMTKAGLWLLIPGVIVCCCGACIAPPTKKR
ncbi:MAG: hypothetical protein ACTSVU_02855 [Promethearchaeota archaeon]